VARAGVCRQAADSSRPPATIDVHRMYDAVYSCLHGV
jgi:hypothetical protein